MHYYQRDLVHDLGTPVLSWRRLRILIENLPPDSATARRAWPEGADWGPAEYLLAIIGDATIGGNWQRANAGKATGQSQRPKPLWRPPPRAGPGARSRVEQERDWKRRHVDDGTREVEL